MYWAIVTLTTVGYGDIAPQTPLGKMLASLLMLMGYGVIAVPTGIVTIELTRASQTPPSNQTPSSNQSCPTCGATAHDNDAAHCKYCGTRLVG
jgi:voltage-gated potassium channel